MFGSHHILDAPIASPGAGRVRAQFTNLAAGLRWRGTADIEQLDLAQWMESPPVGPLAGALEIEGDLAHYRAQGVVRGPGLPEPGVRVDARLRYAQQELHFEPLTLETAPGPVLRTTGRMTLGDEPAYAVSADWTNFRWPLTGEALVASPGGSLAAEGWTEFSWRVNGEFRPAAGPSLSGEGAGRITTTAIEVTDSSWQVLGGGVSLAGSLSRDGSNAWSARGRATDVNPAVLREELPGRLSFEFDGSGRGFAADGTWSANVRRLSGTLRGLPASGGGAMRRAPGVIELKDVSLRLGSTRLEADGTLGRNQLPQALGERAHRVRTGRARVAGEKVLLQATPLRGGELAGPPVEQGVVGERSRANAAPASPPLTQSRRRPNARWRTVRTFSRLVPSRAER